MTSQGIISYMVLESLKRDDLPSTDIIKGVLARLGEDGKPIRETRPISKKVQSALQSLTTDGTLTRTKEPSDAKHSFTGERWRYALTNSARETLGWYA